MSRYKQRRKARLEDLDARAGYEEVHAVLIEEKQGIDKLADSEGKVEALGYDLTYAKEERDAALQKAERSERERKHAEGASRRLIAERDAALRDLEELRDPEWTPEEVRKARAERDAALQEMDKWRMEAQGDQSELAAALARAEKAENERDTWQLRAEGFERWKKNYPLLMNDLVHTGAQLAAAEEALSAWFSYLSGAGLAAYRAYRIKYPEEEK